MHVTGEHVNGEPADPEAARDVRRRAANTIYLIDTRFGPRPAKLFVITAGV